MRSRTPSSTATIEQTSNNNKKHKEYGEEYTTTATTTVCTQCKQVIVSSISKGPGIRCSSEEIQLSASFDRLQLSQSAPHLSHGLCQTCYNNINSYLLSSAASEYKNKNNNNDNNNDNNNNNNNPRKTILSKSLSSPQFSRHLPSRPKRVLIVDDNNLQRLIHKRIVEQAGYDCDIAFSGIQALELIQKHSYSFILMDLIMSPMDGWTTAKKIKLSLIQSLGFSSSSPKIIAVTGLAIEENLIKQCKDAGMDDVLHKPISTTILNNVFHKLPISSSSSIVDR